MALTSKEDLSTVLGQLRVHETIELEGPRLRRLFPSTGSHVGAGAEGLASARRFAEQHNCDFTNDDMGRFIKRPPGNPSADPSR